MCIGLQCGLLCFGQGCFDMWLRESQRWTTDPPISGRLPSPWAAATPHTCRKQHLQEKLFPGNLAGFLSLLHSSLCILRGTICWSNLENAMQTEICTFFLVFCCFIGFHLSESPTFQTQRHLELLYTLSFLILLLRWVV